MKQKVQFINSYGKFHEYNFIREVLPEADITVYSDTGYAAPATDEVAHYYASHNVKLVAAKAFDNVKIPKLRQILNLFSGIGIICKSRKERYEYCFVHYLSTRRAILSAFVPRRTKQILITYGSDILRKKNFNEFFFKRMLKRAHCIVFNSGNLRYTFEQAYGDKYKDKCIDIAFPCASFDRLEANIQATTKASAKEQLGLPQDKCIVVCGHTSTEEEQHEKLITALAALDPAICQKLHFVFPMTYGSGNYLRYRSHIKQLLMQSDLSYTVFEEYMPFDQMSLVHIASDIHITSIQTDALSLFLLEQMYAGAHLIYGHWLHYTEFEENPVGADTYDTFTDLPAVLTRVVNGDGRKAPKNYKQVIADINSNERIRQQWQTYFAQDRE